MWDAFFGREVTAGYYRSLADVSPATATTDLAQAVSAGVLSAEGERRGRRYLPTESLYRVTGAALFIEVSRLPHAARDHIVAELGRRLTTTGNALGL